VSVFWCVLQQLGPEGAYRFGRSKSRFLKADGNCATGASDGWDLQDMDFSRRHGY